MSSTLRAALIGGEGQSQIQNNICPSPSTTTAASKIPFLNQLDGTTTSDVKFIFKISEDEEKVIYGHKLILAKVSPVFNKMFFNRDMTTVQDEVQMGQHAFCDQAFSEFIKVLYTEKISPTLIDGLAVDIIIGMLSCADYYDVPYVKKEIVKYLETILVRKNVIPILEAALLFNERDLANKCLLLIDEHTKRVFASEEMRYVKPETLIEIFKRDSLDIKEVALFDLAMNWAETQCERENLEGSDENKRIKLGPAFFEIRFTFLPPEKLSEIVHSGLLTQEESMELLPHYHESGSRKLKDKRIGRSVVFKTNRRLFGLKKKMADRVRESRENPRVERRSRSEEMTRRMLKSGVKESISVADLFMIGFGDDMTKDEIRALVKYYCGTDIKNNKLGRGHRTLSPQR